MPPNIFCITDTIWVYVERIQCGMIFYHHHFSIILILERTVTYVQFESFCDESYILGLSVLRVFRVIRTTSLVCCESQPETPAGGRVKFLRTFN